MDSPQLVEVVPVIVASRQPQEGGGGECSPDIVAEHPVRLEETAVLLQEGQHHAPTRKLVDRESA